APTPHTTRFPYTTLFRSHVSGYRPRHAFPTHRGLREAHRDHRRRVRRHVHGPAPPAETALRAAPRRGRRHRRRPEVLHDLPAVPDRKSTRLNSSHVKISY